MVGRFSLITGIVFVFAINTTSADERENLTSEDVVFVLEKIGQLLKDKDYGKFRAVYPQFLEILTKYWNENELNNERNPSNNFAKNHEDYAATSLNEVPDSAFQYEPLWVNEEDAKRKRAYHRALCHFKLCNMGSKRSKYWNMWRRST